MVHDSGSKLQGFGYRVYSLENRVVYGSGFSGVQVGFKIYSSGCGIQGKGLRVLVSGA